jgi:hypothetical protein
MRFVIGGAPVCFVIGGHRVYLCYWGEQMLFVIGEAPMHFFIWGALGRFVIEEHFNAFDFL